MFSTKSNAVVGLEIEAGSIAATEVLVNGSVEVTKTAIGDLPPGAFDDGEVVDQEALSSSLRSLFAEHKLSKAVRLGVANQRVSVRTMRLPLIEDPDEIDTAVRFQAQDELPMPLDDAVLDFRVVNRERDEEGSRKMDVLTVAARRDMLTALTAAVRGAGLNPVGIDLSAFALIRALHREAAGQADATTLYCHLGDVTNLAVARGGLCLFSRVSPFGIESVAHSLAERRQLPLDEARRQLIVVGLDGPVEVDGADLSAAREILSEGVAKLVAELRLSLEFYAARDGAVAIDRLVLCGPGSTIEGLADEVERALGYRVDEERPAALASLDDHDAARLTVSYGLGFEEVPA